MTTLQFDVNDRFVREEGRALLTGLQALVRIPLDRRRRDLRDGLETGAFLSGYPGSPVAGFDLTLERNRKLFGDWPLVHEPGVNEELGAAAVWGSQQEACVPYRELDGVVGYWYGKSPGVDRCGDVLKHANFMGVAPRGGALMLVGDDPIAKSSTLPNDSQAALVDAFVPILAPADVQDVLDLGVHGVALSRYSGSWVGLKVVTNIADGFADVDVAGERVRVLTPELELGGRPWRHVQRPNVLPVFSLEQEKEILYGRLEAAREYGYVNELNPVVVRGEHDRVGLIGVGRAFAELEQSLRRLGLDRDELRRRGVRLLKVAMPYPLDDRTLRDFADGLDEVVVVEEKRAFVETRVREALYGTANAPRVLGKRDDAGEQMIPADGELGAERLAAPLARRLRDVAGEALIEPPAPPASRVTPIVLPTLPTAAPTVSRTPAFCSGCPHNTSTTALEGSVSSGGVGCHALMYWEPRHAGEASLAITPMGAEGVPWIGLSPFVGADHVVQNLGDGTFTHSGLLAVRAAVAAGAHMTFRLLVNDAVAMTGGQAVTGGMDVPRIVAELRAEGVAQVLVVADDPGRYPRALRRRLGVLPRERYEEAQLRLREQPGTTVLVFDQQCATEARRMRKRGLIPDVPREVVINEAVCEGCGDCQRKSNCLSVQPVETELGRKTQIHRSSCNKDFSCLDGDCPSFLTVIPAGPKARRAVPAPPIADLPAPPAPRRPKPGRPVEIYMTGIGGTGVVTANQLLATAAFMEGFDVAGLDQTGLSQKAGPVVSHLRIAAGERLPTNVVGGGAADVYLGFDAIVAADPRHLAKIASGRTRTVVSTSDVPTLERIMDVEEPAPRLDRLAERIERAAGQERPVRVDSVKLAESLFGDHMPANTIVLGAACQAGVLPVGVEAIEAAIRANGTAVEANLAALAWGRCSVVDPAAVAARLAPRVGAVDLQPDARSLAVADELLDGVALPGAAAQTARRRAAELVEYQDRKLAARYVGFLAEVARRDADEALAEAVARGLFKLMAYKDEYEVARLHLSPQLHASLEAEYPGAELRIMLHPPLLRALGMKRKIAFGRWFLPALRLLRRGRVLRGTPLDPFGYAKVRRVERALVDEYRELLRRGFAAGLAPERLLALAELPELVRGYEEIKLEGVAAFRARAQELLAGGAAETAQPPLAATR